jgi:hypothetical protein
MKVSQTEHANALIRDMHALDARAAEIERTVDQAAFDWIPPEGGWSVGQVFEHLCVANDDYLRTLRSIIGEASSPRASPAPGMTWRSSFAGGILARSMQSPRKLRAPKSWTPASVPREQVIDEFLARQREIVQLIERSSAREWNRMRLASPVSSFIRMNVGDAFTILVRHAERHVRQIDERLAAFDAVRGDRVAASR